MVIKKVVMLIKTLNKKAFKNSYLVSELVNDDTSHKLTLH